MFNKVFSMAGALVVLLTIAIILSIGGCGGGSGPDAVRNEVDPKPATAEASTATVKSKKPGAASDKPKYDPTSAVGSIKGVVSFEGKAPNNPLIPVSEPKCAEHHGAKGLFAENWVVSDANKIANVIVYVSEGGDKFNFDDLPMPPARINQLGCQYIPHVLAMKTDQTLEIQSDDPIGHNIHCEPSQSKPFNLSQPNKGIHESKPSFDKPEMGILVKCDVHNWMKSYICVFDHPFFAVTGPDGSFEIKVPPGDYTIKVWQESMQNKTITSPKPVAVSVAKDKSGEANFVFVRKQ